MGINIARVKTTGATDIVSIEVNGGFYPVPRFIPNTYTPNWASISYAPTRVALQTAWDTWAATVESVEYEVRDRPDLAEAEVLEPDWQKFFNGMDLPIRGGNGLFALGYGNPATFPLFSELANVLRFLVRDGGTNTPEYLSWYYLYEQAIQIYTPEQKVIIETLLTECNIPFPN